MEDSRSSHECALSLHARCNSSKKPLGDEDKEASFIELEWKTHDPVMNAPYLFTHAATRDSIHIPRREGKLLTFAPVVLNGAIVDLREISATQCRSQP